MLVDRSIPSFTKLLWLGARNRGECAKLALRSWMAYGNQEDIRLAMVINQNMLRHVKPGQRAEVVFKFSPGRTFEAAVESIAFMYAPGPAAANRHRRCQPRVGKLLASGT